ncbi:MAG: hypothetical protein ACP5O3_00880 [Candidatus Micrarchaeia archaeon]
MKKTGKEKTKPEKRVEQPTLEKSGALVWVAAAAVIVILFIAAAFLFKEPVAQQHNEFKPVKLELFVNGLDSKSQEAELAVKRVLEEFGSNVSLQMYFVVAFEGYAFRAQGGEEEVAEDARQACAQKHYPEIFFDFVACRANGIDGRTCGKQTGVDYDVVSACAEGQEGKQLLEESFRVASALRVRAINAPVLYVNTTLLQKPVTVTSVMQAVCGVIPSHEACARIPACSADFECAAGEGAVGKCVDAGKLSAKCIYSAAERVNLTVFTDSSCGPCDAQPVVSVLKGYFKGLNASFEDVSTIAGAGKARYLGLTGVPAFVFDESVKKGEGYEKVKDDLLSVGGYYVLSPALVFADKNGKAIASTAPSKFLQRQAKNNSLTLFAMGKCPASAVAAAIVGDVASALENSSFDVRFVVKRYANNSLYAASAAELDEDARQACAFSINSSAFAAYVACGINSSMAWQDCAVQAGYNATKIADCVERQGKFLLERDADFVTQAGVNGAPAVLINNQVLVREIPSAEKLKEWYCLANRGARGCDARLSDENVMEDLKSCFVS